MGVAISQTVVVSAEQLAARLRDGAGTVVLEVGRDSEAADLEGHVPGARSVVLERDLVGRWTETSGNAPLPEAGELQALLRQWGVDDDTTLVVYSTETPPVPTRARWTLPWSG